MKIPSVNPDKIRRNAMLTRELRREAWAMPALVLGTGVAFSCFGLLASAVRQGHAGTSGVYVLYAMLAAFAGCLAWSCLRGSGRSTGADAYEPPSREPTAIISPVEPQDRFSAPNASGSQPGSRRSAAVAGGVVSCSGPAWTGPYRVTVRGARSPRT
jgi:hypothetical protein